MEKIETKDKYDKLRMVPSIRNLHIFPPFRFSFSIGLTVLLVRQEIPFHSEGVDRCGTRWILDVK